jgi:hypothetical protein
MQRSIGPAVAAAFMALTLTSPALAAEEWWYGGKIPEDGYLYADALTLKRYDEEATIEVMLVFPGSTNGLYFADARIECSFDDGYFEQFIRHDGEKEIVEKDIEMSDEEYDIIFSMACSDKADWPGLGYKPTPKAIDDAFARAQ